MNLECATAEPSYGIAAIALYDPSHHELRLSNAWFESRGIIGRKFVAHTGIVSRGISFLSEQEMAMRAIESLKLQTGFDVNDCAGLVLSSCSLVPSDQPDWRRDCLRALGRWEALHKRIAPATGLSEELLLTLEWNDEFKDWQGIRRLADRIGISVEQLGALERNYLREVGSLEETTAAIACELAMPPAKARGLNWGCSGYVRGWQALEDDLIPTVRLTSEQFFLLVTVGRTSKFTDFGASDTGALFGDFATATLITHRENPLHPPRLLLRHASTALAETRLLSPDAALLSEALFDYQRRTNVLTPTPDGGDDRVPDRLCWTMDGVGVLYAAGPAMACAVERALDGLQIDVAGIEWLLGHQPGRKVMERAAIGLREQGYRGQLPLGLMATTGNVSCSSIPHALSSHWDQLDGLVACPAIGMYAPGSRFMSQGCLVFEVVAVPRRPNVTTFTSNAAVVEAELDQVG
jgi:3-oxoacyl-[acyl-carrier-protein] synthase III